MFWYNGYMVSLHITFGGTSLLCTAPVTGTLSQVIWPLVWLPVSKPKRSSWAVAVYTQSSASSRDSTWSATKNNWRWWNKESTIWFYWDQKPIICVWVEYSLPSVSARQAGKASSISSTCEFTAASDVGASTLTFPLLFTLDLAEGRLGHVLGKLIGEYRTIVTVQLPKFCTPVFLCEQVLWIGKNGLGWCWEPIKCFPEALVIVSVSDAKYWDIFALCYISFNLRRMILCSNWLFEAFAETTLSCSKCWKDYLYVHLWNSLPVRSSSRKLTYPRPEENWLLMP